jgi:tRNA pseudouridine55 synthase
MVIKTDQIVPVNKPIGFSTYDLVRIFKRETGFKGKIGHGGTLDPFATGVALLLLGKATTRFEEIRSWTKVYLAGIRLGAASSTQDITGSITQISDADFSKMEKKDIESALAGFTGKIEQKVPAYSAAKHEGVPMYKLARQGIETPEKSKTVEIFSIELVYFRPPILTCRVCCAGGVYIRQLAQDLGEKLNVGGFLYHLEREKVGDYGLKDCLGVGNFKTISFAD